MYDGTHVIVYKYRRGFLWNIIVSLSSWLYYKWLLKSCLKIRSLKRLQISWVWRENVKTVKLSGKPTETLGVWVVQLLCWLY